MIQLVLEAFFTRQSTDHIISQLPEDILCQAVGAKFVWRRAWLQDEVPPELTRMPLVAWSNGGFFGEKKGIEWGLTGDSFQRTVWLIDLFGFVRTVVEDEDEWGYNSPINLLWYLF